VGPCHFSEKLGPLVDEINVDGYKRKAHVDHLRPPPFTESQEEDLAPTSDESHADDPILLVVVDEESDKTIDTPFPELHGFVYIAVKHYKLFPFLNLNSQSKYGYRLKSLSTPHIAILATTHP